MALCLSGFTIVTKAQSILPTCTFPREHRMWYIIIPHTDNNLHLTEEVIFPFDSFHLQKLLIPVIKATLVARHKSS